MSSCDLYVVFVGSDWVRWGLNRKLLVVKFVCGRGGYFGLVSVRIAPQRFHIVPSGFSG